jgi:two-component system, NtrC family, response regulator AtoC
MGMEIETLFTTEAGDALARAARPIIESPTLRQVYGQADRAADGSVNVLIVGEPGVGKRTLARWIHLRSRRARSPLVTLECAPRDLSVGIALFGCSAHAFVGPARDRPSALVAADGGTVILDSIHGLTLATQATLLRTIETGVVVRMAEAQGRPVDVRIVSTASPDLERAVRERLFRADLFNRLSPVMLCVPPLRERRDEIEPLARHFLAGVSTGNPSRLSVSVLDLFRSFAWPGNLAQLRDVIKAARARCTGPEITPEHVDGEALARERIPEPRNEAEPPGPELWTVEQRQERRRLVNALADAEGNTTRAAANLGLPRRTMVTKMDLYGLSRPALAAYVGKPGPREK